MKTRLWIALLALILILSAASALLLLRPGEDATQARILSGGQVVRVVDLAIDQTFTVPSPSGGYNTVTVSGGKIAVTEASCPDHYCAKRGYCAGGADIVCLPNQLVIQFLAEQEIDAVIG